MTKIPLLENQALHHKIVQLDWEQSESLLPTTRFHIYTNVGN